MIHGRALLHFKQDRYETIKYVFQYLGIYYVDLYMYRLKEVFIVQYVLYS
jgi:hypothetical protein